MNSVHVEGRRWHRRSYGGMYCTAAIYVDGKFVGATPEQGGSGDYYRQEAQEWLEREGYLPGLRVYDSGGREPLWQYCRDRGIALTFDVTDVSRERDLHWGGEGGVVEGVVTPRMAQVACATPHGRCATKGRCLEPVPDEEKCR